MIGPKGEQRLAADGGQIGTAKILSVEKGKATIEVSGKTYMLTPDRKACEMGMTAPARHKVPSSRPSRSRWIPRSSRSKKPVAKR